jgi:peptidoglycan/xylan/chitin deacetylase (PgdA/CDA1 family)
MDYFGMGNTLKVNTGAITNYYILLNVAMTLAILPLAQPRHSFAQENPVAVSSPAPENAVIAFYEAIQNKDCLKAAELRPGYSVSGCQSVKYLRLDSSNVHLKKRSHLKAIVHIKVNYKKIDVKQETTFSGYLTLTNNGSSWFIENESYKGYPEDNEQYLWIYIVGQKIKGFEENKTAETEETKSVQEANKKAKQRANSEETLQIEPENELLIQIKETPLSVDDSKPAAHQDTSQLTFGSQTILESCWTQAELRGSPKDKQIVKLKSSDYSPPAKAEPDVQNSSLPLELQNSIRSVSPFPYRKIVALTFDLCERASEITGYDAEIVNYLRDENVKATFFASGKWMRSHPEKTMQLMADPLFEIGNHAWTHGNFSVLTDKEASLQIFWTQAQYEILRDELFKKNCQEMNPQQMQEEMKKIPPSLNLFRLPYGRCRSETLDMLARNGLKAIQWSLVTGDPAPRQTAQSINNAVLAQIKPGDIIIFHANGRGHGTAESLPRIIPTLREKGYLFVTVSELLQMGKAVATRECFEIKPGDNARYDKIFGKGIE